MILAFINNTSSKQCLTEIIVCGIIFAKNVSGKNVNFDIKKTYFAQKERGKQGYGFVNVKTGAYFRRKYEHQILEALKKNAGSEILFHHRRPTSTGNVEIAAHPLCSNDNFPEHKYYLVHNGTIGNAKTLYSKHINDGLVYSSLVGKDKWGFPAFNDSESLMMELALVIEGKKTLDKFNAYGSMAFIMLQTDKENNPLNLYFGRNTGSPLKINMNAEKIMIASDIEGDDIEVNKLWKMCYADNKLTSQDVTFSRYYSKDDNTDLIMAHDRITYLNNNHGKETPEMRHSIINRTCPIIDLEDDNIDEQVLTLKTNEELQELQEGFMGDISNADIMMQGEHDPNELSRIRGEKRELEKALGQVDAEIDRRIKACELMSGNYC